MRMRDRNKFPPGGWRFQSPQTNWSISPWVSFDAAVAEIIAHRRANPYQTQVNHWSLDPVVAANELDAFNAMVCQQMGWTQYITEGGPDTPLPKASPLSQLRQSVERAVAGVRTISDWEIASGKVVERSLANARARTCSLCPLNQLGDLSTWFTEKAAELIRKQLESKNNLKLVTDYDPLLGVCDACGCVNKLSVWAPLDIKLKHMNPETKAALHSSCWVIAEDKSGK